MRAVGNSKSALSGEPANDSVLSYPKDKVVNIRKGLRLRRKV